MASTVLARHAALRNRYVKKSGPQNKLSRLKEKGRRRAARRRRRAAAGEKRPHPPDPAKKSGPLTAFGGMLDARRHYRGGKSGAQACRVIRISGTLVSSSENHSRL